MRREKRLLGDTAHAHGVAGVARQVFSGRGAEERQCPSTPLRFSLDALRAFPARYRSPSPLWRQRMTWSHPEVAKLLATCPFNARHLVPRADLVDHIAKCRDKGFIEHDIAHCSSGFQRDEVNAVSTWQAPPCDEDWETELLEEPNSPFIWGMTNSGINSCSVTSGQKNYLPSSVRAPESSPYAASWKD
ncbi:gametocyte-specific factor 1 isoform X1 [Lagopus muta]|uniref:gametocyte-specific factor 1 isoform X1 n=1 Tax=Lagopus muta TaxID=64668 RepID=UPI0020A0A6AA|nr:gametocyte-specific factor 1 isoform X1 [Lagopus muta]